MRSEDGNHLHSWIHKDFCSAFFSAFSNLTENKSTEPNNPAKHCSSVIVLTRFLANTLFMLWSSSENLSGVCPSRAVLSHAFSVLTTKPSVCNLAENGGALDPSDAKMMLDSLNKTSAQEVMSACTRLMTRLCNMQSSKNTDHGIAKPFVPVNAIAGDVSRKNGHVAGCSKRQLKMLKTVTS
jgi:hypothetical protein